jgi:hypothetical protein
VRKAEEEGNLLKKRKLKIKCNVESQDVSSLVCDL